ncbi:MAG: 30S ribosomal protein S27ae [Candidatus Jordarchaeum sp.]|uniref:30S ribosomal protein S27ae n=1 Tax=Candidatus Jordarchaeum sp. TaxID=2823881 RepID=UPI00404B34BA
MSKYYKITGDKIERLRVHCPRCGSGIFMANHYDRMSCGKCGYTEFKKKEPKENEEKEG